MKYILPVLRVFIGSKDKLSDAVHSKRTLLFLLLLFISFSAFYIKTVSGQTPLISSMPPAPSESVPTLPVEQKQTWSVNADPGVPQTLGTYMQAVTIEGLSTMSCMLSGYSFTDPQGRCLGINSSTGRIGYVQNNTGLIGMTTSMITMTFDIPVSSSTHFQYLASNFGIAKKTYAQTGVGFSGLWPLHGIWLTFRSIAYLFVVLITIIIGLGVMLRFQIDPRTVMTIQNQIPKIIVTLLLITFSFPIAGLMIDLMWVMVYLVFVLAGASNTQLLVALNSEMQGIASVNHTPFAFAHALYLNLASMNLFTGGTITPPGGLIAVPVAASQAAGDIFGRIFSDMIGTQAAGRAIGSIVAIFAIDKLPGCFTGSLSILPLKFDSVTWDTCWQGATKQGATNLGSIVAFLIFLIALLWALFRLWFRLIKAYIFIIVDVILAPLWILVGLIPGSTTGFGSWIRDLLANLLVFPATILMFFMGYILMVTVSQGQMFRPPLIGDTANSGGSFAALIGLGVILMVPEGLNMLREALKAPQFKYTAAVGAAMGAGAKYIGGASGYAVGKTWQGFMRRDNLGTPMGSLAAKLDQSVKRPFLRNVMGLGRPRSLSDTNWQEHKYSHGLMSPKERKEYERTQKDKIENEQKEMKQRIDNQNNAFTEAVRQGMQGSQAGTQGHGGGNPSAPPDNGHQQVNQSADRAANALDKFAQTAERAGHTLDSKYKQSPEYQGIYKGYQDKLHEKHFGSKDISGFTSDEYKKRTETDEFERDRLKAEQAATFDFRRKHPDVANQFAAATQGGTDPDQKKNK